MSETPLCWRGSLLCVLVVVTEKIPHFLLVVVFQMLTGVGKLSDITIGLSAFDPSKAFCVGQIFAERDHYSAPRRHGFVPFYALDAASSASHATGMNMACPTRRSFT